MLYFAYGSNMHLTQMAERCPSSILKGIGSLAGYRWQINSRGVANIVESRNHRVEGVVFQIDQGSKRQLDRNEGVSRGFYNDEHLPILFTPSAEGDFKTGYMAKRLKNATASRQNDIDLERSNIQPGLQGQTTASFTVNALVYISKNYMEDGDIRDEYIGRMEKALADGQKLGLSRWFLEQVDDIIHRPPRFSSPKRQSTTIRRHSPEREYTPERYSLIEDRPRVLTKPPPHHARPTSSIHYTDGRGCQEPYYVLREPQPVSQVTISNTNGRTISRGRGSRASSAPPRFRDTWTCEIRYPWVNEIRSWF